MKEADTTWNSIWSLRGKEFNKSLTIAPTAREAEIRPLLNGLKIRSGMSFLEVGPCAGSLLRAVKEAFSDDISIMAIEPAEIHAESLPGYVQVVAESDITNFSLEDCDIDRVGNLAALHHTEKEKQADFFYESYRVLKQNGVLGIADVMTDTNVAEWLNVFVDRYNSYGHKGYFLQEGELKANLESAGFSKVKENYLDYYWRFASVDQMIAYCKSIFCLNLADDKIILQGIEDILSYQVTKSNEVLMRWGLLYGFGEKA